jgi:CRISPR/Cas system CSM-associated protein Csm5 (group 7 of RAMP superfamily)
MNIYKFMLSRYNKNKSIVIAFPNTQAAMQDPSKGLLIIDEKDLVDKTIVRSDDMVDIFNNYAPAESQIKRFSDRATGAKRLMDLLAKLVSTRKIEVRRGNIPVVKNIIVDSRGRKSKFNNKRIVSIVDNVTNPRRKGSHGFRSYQMILDNPNIAYEEFLRLGGRRQDLAHDVIMKRFKVIR